MFPFRRTRYAQGGHGDAGLDDRTPHDHHGLDHAWASRATWREPARWFRALATAAWSWSHPASPACRGRRRRGAGDRSRRPGACRRRWRRIDRRPTCGASHEPATIPVEVIVPNRTAARTSMASTRRTGRADLKDSGTPWRPRQRSATPNVPATAVRPRRRRRSSAAASTSWPTAAGHAIDRTRGRHGCRRSHARGWHRRQAGRRSSRRCAVRATGLPPYEFHARIAGYEVDFCIVGHADRARVRRVASSTPRPAPSRRPTPPRVRRPRPSTATSRCGSRYHQIVRDPPRQAHRILGIVRRWAPLDLGARVLGSETSAPRSRCETIRAQMSRARRGYFGGMRMPPSTRIVSALR